MFFDRIIIIDWSAADRPTAPKPSANALWVGQCTEMGAAAPRYFRSRASLYEWLFDQLRSSISKKERVLLGFDFVYGYPAGLTTALGLAGNLPWQSIWAYWHELISDGPKNANNRFTVAQLLNERLSGAAYPFWGCPVSKAGVYLSSRKQQPFPLTANGVVLHEKRLVDRQHPHLQSAWKLAYPASVGSQALTGIPYLYRLRFLEPALSAYSLVWPFETGFQLPDQPGPLLLHAEIWPSLVSVPDGPLPKDARQVMALSQALWGWNETGQLFQHFNQPDSLSAEQLSQVVLEEGWILGFSS